MKHQLTIDDEQFFLDPANWRGGPMYEIRLFYPLLFTENEIFDVVVSNSQISHWKPVADPMPMLSKSILQISNLPSVGLVHHYQELLFGVAEYSLGIFQVQFERTIGRKLGTETCGWTLMDAHRLSTFHNSLFSVVRSIAETSPLACAVICPEHWGHVLVSEADQTICIAKGLADALKLTQTRELVGNDYFSAINL